MPDENRFAGLSEAVEEDANDADEENGTANEATAEAASAEETPGVNPADAASADAESSPSSSDIVDSLHIPECPDTAERPDGADSVGDTDGQEQTAASVGDTDGQEQTAARNDEPDEAGVDALTTDQRRAVTDPSAADSSDMAESSNSVDGSESADCSDIAESSDMVEGSNIVDSSGISDSVNIPDSEDAPDHANSGDGADGKGGSTPGAAGPAFEFDDTEQHSVYVRPKAWQRVEDAEALVDARLRADYELRDLTGREFQDAVLRVAADHEDELVEAILAARGATESSTHD
jgi:hypothetical protein